MEPTLVIKSSTASSLFQLKSTQKPSYPIFKHFSSSSPFTHLRKLSIKASSTSKASSPNPLISTLKTAAAAVVLGAAVFGKFHGLPARAADPSPVLTMEEGEETQEDNVHENQESSPLTQFLESNSEAVEALKTLLQQKLEAGEDEESLKILDKLSLAQPETTEWKFLLARLLNELGRTGEAREVFEKILSVNPLSFEALFENALLMDRCGEGPAVIGRLEEALKIAAEENKVKEARDVKLIMAQVQFLQKNVEEALKSYDELVKEDPKDFRPYFCKGMIYSLLDRNTEAKEQFAKYRELSPKKFEVEGYLRSPLSRMKLFGIEEEN